MHLLGASNYCFRSDQNYKCGRKKQNQVFISSVLKVPLMFFHIYSAPFRSPPLVQGKGFLCLCPLSLVRQDLLCHGKQSTAVCSAAPQIILLLQISLWESARIAILQWITCCWMHSNTSSLFLLYSVIYKGDGGFPPPPPLWEGTGGSLWRAGGASTSAIISINTDSPMEMESAQCYF